VSILTKRVRFMEHKFINRKSEIDSLEKKWEEKKSHLIIVYGKRRVGKTEIIKQFIKNKPSVYFLADKRTINEQLKELGRLFGAHFKDALLEKNGFTDDMLKLAKQERVYLVNKNELIEMQE